MSAPTVKPVKPRNWLERFATLDRLATVVTWVFWLGVVATAAELILALTRSGAVMVPIPSSQPTAKVCLTTAPALLQHAGSGLSHPGLSPGVRATWDTASLCTAHPTTGQYLAFAITLLPLDLLRLGALYLTMRLARTAAADGVYTARFARLLLILGWWLVAGGLVATVAEAFARMNLLSRLVTWHVDWAQWPRGLPNRAHSARRGHDAPALPVRLPAGRAAAATLAPSLQRVLQAAQHPGIVRGVKQLVYPVASSRDILMLRRWRWPRPSSTSTRSTSPQLRRCCTPKRRRTPSTLPCGRSPRWQPGGVTCSG
jgi:hypothetical protein